MAGDVKKKMIERTAILLAKKGLQGTSFSEVLEASGAPRGSLYHHFPGGKNELVLAALQASGDQALSALNITSGKSAVDVARAFIDLWRAVLTKSNFSAGCAVVAVSVAADTPELIATAAGVFRSWRVRLGELLSSDGISMKKAQALATNLIAACEGAVILARVEKSFAPFDLVAEEQLAAIHAASEAAKK